MTSARHRQRAPAVPGDLKLLRWAVSIWVVVSFARPQDLVPLLKLLQPGLLSLVLVLVAIVREHPQIQWRDTRVRCGLIIIIVIASGVLVAVNHFWLLQSFIDFTGFLVVFLLAMPALLADERWRRIIMNFAICVCCFLAVWCMLHGGHGYSSHTEDENDAALFLGMGLAFAGARAMDPQLKGSLRLLFTLAAVLCFAGVIATNSRGGLVGAVASLMMILYLSGRMIKGLVTVAVIALLALPLVPKEYFGEMQTMSNADDGTRRQRLFFWGVAWQEFLSSPIIGVGAGNYPWRIGDFQEATPELAAYVAEYRRSYAGRSVHSSYFQIISELGAVGMAAFLTSVFSTLLLCRSICKSNAATPEIKVYAQATAGALLSTCAGGAFLSAAFFPNFWMLFGMGTALAAHGRPAEEPKRVPFGKRAAAGQNRSNGTLTPPA